MSRVRAEALVLVNWKGVFYERYLLDRHVTALEGDNGAGKTTVMIAAYVVLLPDMTRLRFTNLGETGATGGDKGIWGRLGEPGRPAYAALDFRLPRGERVLAGVHLERKGEPTVEPTPFIVTGLGDDVRAQDLLLLADGELEQVPELTELRDAAGRLGGRLQQFSSARDYFAALFELGITPMRLGTDEERNKLNEMLKTSMTGGMSKGLLQELRSFLLKEEGGLADTLQRMRANLDACRRTRTEVLEAQRLEREIGDVYEAGEQMFAAAVAGTRQRAEEATRRVADAEARRRESAASAEAAEQALTEARDAVTRAEGRKVEATVAADEAAAWERRVDEALTWARKLAACAGGLDEAVRRRDAALAAREAADEALVRATTAVGAASDARERAAAGLADLQQGLEELHRRAAAHRRATARLADARRLLDEPAIDANAATVVDVEASAALARVDEERRDIARRVDDASAHRAEHAAASAALVAVLDRPVDVDVAYDAALAVLADVRAWRDAAARRPALATELRAAEADATRQARVVERAGALGLLWGDRGSLMTARALIKSGSSASAPTTGREAAATALAEVETALTALEDEARAADEAAAEALRRLEASRADGAALEARAVAYAALSARADRLAAVASAPVTSRLELDVARAALTDRRTAIGARLGDLSARREALSDEARRLTQAGGSFAPELLKLRDDLTAELLASRFDDVGVDEAARLEARLGPLAQALVVPDPEAATARLADRPATLPTVWLVAEDAALALGPDEVLGGDVIVDERDARRVTRIPARPTLGRAARERQAAALTREAEALEPEIEAARQDERAARSAQSDADALLEGLATWLLGDPAAEIEASRQRARDAETASQAARREAARARADAGRLRPRRQALLELLPDAALLDAPDQAARVTRLREALAASERAGAELARVGGAPVTLERGLEALRRCPWTDDEVADARTRLSSLDARRDQLSEGLEALRFVVTNREALRWSDAEARLTERQGLVPALEAQLAAAKDALDRARTEETGARATRDKATSAFHEADARHATARERRDEAASRLAEAGVADPSEATLAAARAQAADARAALAAAEAEHGRLREEVGRADSVHRAAAQAAEGARVAEEDERRQARPALEGWDRLRPQVEAAGLLAASMSDRFMALFAGRGSVNLFPMAHEARALLFERLRTAQRGPEVLERLERGLGEVDQTTGEGYLRAWIVVRDWLRSCLPAQIAEMDEPLAALGRFRDHLADLVARLERQERDLRGASEDVARGIDVQVRKARGRVRRLNEHLVGVAFGSIRGIRVRMERVERMERVLHALRSGEAQGLLFQEDLPVEDALDEIFKRFGGGRTGGQRLLDYREYLHLHVEVLRQDAAGWEVANPTRLSTGEAIGVGAALMMVVLTEWERDANLLRGRRSFGSMRFLFLDEANRLDQANLGTVFDLCRNLDLQLLVAAPEVARAEGCTVFRLVRTRGGDGREEVLVSGRRVVADAAEA